MSSTSICRCVCRFLPLALRPSPRTIVPAAHVLLNNIVAPTVALSSRQLHLTPFNSSTANVVGKEEELVPERLYDKVTIKVKGADFMVLESYCRFVITAGKALGINISGRVALPTRIQKFTVLKSVHIFKKHRVQYEVRTHMRLMKVRQITGTTSDIFLEYIQRNLPEGVSMKVAQERIDTLPTLLTSPPEGEEPPTKAATTKPTKARKWKR